eukprot:UN17857
MRLDDLLASPVFGFGEGSEEERLSAVPRRYDRERREHVLQQLEIHPHGLAREDVGHLFDEISGTERHNISREDLETWFEKINTMQTLRFEKFWEIASQEDVDGNEEMGIVEFEEFLLRLLTTTAISMLKNDLNFYR